MQECTITLVGNVVADPQIRFTTSGIAFTSFRVASTPRFRDRATGSWVDGASVFLPVTCWRSLAENVATSLHKGDRVLVVGRLRQRSFTTKEGDERTVYEVEADTVAPDLTRYEVSLRKALRAQSGDAPSPAGDAALSSATADPFGETAVTAAASPAQAGAAA